MDSHKARLSHWGILVLVLTGSTAVANAAPVSTTTTLSPSPLTAFTTSPNNIVTLTATVTGSGATGTVTFKDGGVAVTCAGGNPAALSNGSATCTTIFSIEGVHSLSASYSGDGTFNPSAGTANVYIQNHAPNSTTTYCNSGAISANGNSNLAFSNTQPYPSVIFVGDGVNTDITSHDVSTVSVQLKNFFTTNTSNLHMLLVAPDQTHSLDFWSNAGSSVSAGNFTLIDGATQLPTTGAIAPGSYAPSYYATTLDSFLPGPPSPAPQIPATFTSAPPFGSATFETAFNGATAHGAWSLYFSDDSGTPAAISGGWCLNITANTSTSTTTSITGSPNPASFTPPSTTAGVTLTATVSAPSGTGLTVAEGVVTFTDGPTVLGITSVSNGQTILPTSLTEGTHQIVASYHDPGNNFGDSSGTFDLRVNAATTNPASGSGAGPYTYCNTNSITVPAAGFLSGPAAPYPSNIFVTNLPGTVNALTVTLNGFSTNDQGDLLSLLVGPGGNNYDFFSLTGSSVSNPPSPLNVAFSDTAATIISGNLTFSGTFRPTSFNTNITYPQCPLNASGCASPPVGPPLPSNPFTPTNKAPIAGTEALGNANLAGVFGGTSSSTYNPNGEWSLYINDVGPNGDGKLTKVNGGWCLNITANLPTVTAVLSHGETFTQGQQAVPFTINITNNGHGATGDPTGGNNPLTVTDTLNSVFSFAGSSGTGWSCSAVTQVVTCLNHASVAEGSSYVPLAINVNVSPTASVGTPIINRVQVSGGGAIPTPSNIDTVTILGAPVLAIQKSHTGNFTQGQTAQWNITISNTATGTSTIGTITMTDTLPTGYALASSTSTGNEWNCSGTTTVTCTSTGAISGGASSNINLTLNVPASSPVSVTNTARVFGGGDLTHTNATNAASSSDTATVAQAPASVTISGGNNQSAATGTAFATPLSVTVKDGNSVPIPSTQVTFTANPGSNGQSGTFSNSTGMISVSTNGSGVASSGTFTANSKAGSYTVTATAGSASANFNLTNTSNTTPPATVVSYNVLFGSQSFSLIGSTRNRLPWEITGIRVVFSQPIAAGNANSLTGVTATGFSGLGTNTLTWTISPTPIGSFATTLLASGANAIKDANGNALNGGTNFSQNFKVLWGDFNDDGVVSASDSVLVNSARSAPYNIFADLNGDGVVDANDVNIVRSRMGTSQP